MVVCSSWYPRDSLIIKCYNYHRNLPRNCFTEKKARHKVGAVRWVAVQLQYSYSTVTFRGKKLQPLKCVRLAKHLKVAPSMIGDWSDLQLLSPSSQTLPGHDIERLTVTLLLFYFVFLNFFSCSIEFYCYVVICNK